ncbi:hypothetical protein [Agrococcus jejuensis]|uniref:hypothetical protein n=1 Tax=Agrococcus jejuensis TaxID=399736 RepID=UPI0011A50CA2|nr:hypothetical protein [Agrococcus jejuensis]
MTSLSGTPYGQPTQHQPSAYLQPAPYGSPQHLAQQPYAYAAAYAAPRSPKTTFGVAAVPVLTAGCADGCVRALSTRRR